MKTAYPSTHTTCSIRLYSNIPFDNTYQHHTLISSLFTYYNAQVYSTTSQLKACERFIDRKNWSATGKPYYYPRYDMTGEFNFNFQNGLVGNVTLELSSAETNANYMRLTCGSDVYYYFITSIQQVNADTYSLSLELDVLMTYGDEFLSGMKDVPVFTERKHCHRYTNDGLYPHCADLKRGESVFAGVKPNIITSKTQLNLSNNDSINSIKWLYFCVDQQYAHTPSEPETEADREFWQIIRYSYSNSNFPLVMCCVPINVTSFTITDGDEVTKTLSNVQIRSIFDSLVSAGQIHGAKISSYPPYILGVGDTIVMDSSRNVTLTSNYVNSATTPTSYTYYDNEKSSLIFPYAYWRTGFIVAYEQRVDYNLGKVELNIKNDAKPTPTSNRYLDPKLLFNPFRKYVLTSSYSSGNEFFPEIIYSDGVYKSKDFKFSTTYTSYIGDYTIFSYQQSLTDANSKVFYNNYKENNIGLSATVNYTMPVGTNALDVFNATQSQTFYTSKVASGVTSGLSILGGVGSIALGVTTMGASSGASALGSYGLIAGGITAIAGGLGSMATTIKSTNAKIEDLKNTPDAINVQGGSYVGDFSRNVDLPFIVVYDVASALKEQADDYFYNYGYEVARECFFNTELKYNNDTSYIVDNNLFGRDIFNYIKLNEDITNKIDADIPHVVKQKISQIFNKGITLWSWFGVSELWGATSSEPTSQYYLNNWFMKCKLDNTEIDFVFLP